MDRGGAGDEHGGRPIEESAPLGQPEPEPEPEAPPTEQVPVRPARRRWSRGRRRSVALGLLALAALLVVLTYAGMRADQYGGLVVLIEVFDHPLPLGALAGVLLALAILIGIRSVSARALLIALLLGWTLLISPVALLLFDDMPQKTAVRPAPGRPDRSLVIHEGAAMIDPLWWVSVDEGSGLSARRWPVGFFNGDATDNELTSAEWDGPDRIRLATRGGEVFVVALDPETGRPGQQVRAG
ncbi:hypothetical protein [Kitasatospora purpeofusca]|uniref:hypothetical protein n=1 Tax=Kitasatospora purpeofusca TaxID=67352 RepID=UPI0035DF12E7